MLANLYSAALAWLRQTKTRERPFRAVAACNAAGRITVGCLSRDGVDTYVWRFHQREVDAFVEWVLLCRSAKRALAEYERWALATFATQICADYRPGWYQLRLKDKQ